MNQRIYELALQAEMAANNGDHVDVKIMMAKFGALILAECIEQVWYTRKDIINGNVSEVIKQRIKQHFGVEE